MLNNPSFIFIKSFLKISPFSILTLFRSAYYKGFLKILNLFLMILTEKRNVLYTFFSQIPVDESCMSDYNSIIKSINTLKH